MMLDANLIGLPFIASRPIVGRIIADDATGFICLDTTGTVIELNQRAHELASKYRQAIGITQCCDFLQQFVMRAVETIRSRWQVVHTSGETVLEMRLHALAKEKDLVSDDYQLLKMQEWTLPQSTQNNLPPEVEKLTPRQRQIAMLLGQTHLGYKQIADQLGITEGTMRTHVEHVYRALHVHSRPEIIAIVNGRKA